MPSPFRAVFRRLLAFWGSFSVVKLGSMGYGPEQVVDQLALKEQPQLEAGPRDPLEVETFLFPEETLVLGSRTGASGISISGNSIGATVGECFRGGCLDISGLTGRVQSWTSLFSNATHCPCDICRIEIQRLHFRQRRRYELPMQTCLAQKAAG